MTPSIEVGKLRKTFGGVTAVDGVSFTSHAGGIFGLLGPNGAGKTTTIGCISGLLTPAAGRGAARGHDVVREGTRARRALGVLLASLARTEGQVVAIGVICTNLLAGLGGCWWPIEITPAWARALAKALPTGWAMDGLHLLVSFGAPPATVIPHAAALAAAALAAGWAAARTFRFQ